MKHHQMMKVITVTNHHRLHLTQTRAVTWSQVMKNMFIVRQELDRNVLPRFLNCRQKNVYVNVEKAEMIKSIDLAEANKYTNLLLKKVIVIDLHQMRIPVDVRGKEKCKIEKQLINIHSFQHKSIHSDRENI